MKKLHDFQLVTSFIGLMISIFSLNADPTFYSFISAVLFAVLMISSSCIAFDEENSNAK